MSTSSKGSDFSYFREVTSRSLTWARSDTNGFTFDLTLGSGDTLARFWKIGSLAPRARGATVAGTWELARSGFLKRNINIRSDSGTDLAVFKQPGIFGGGKLVFGDGTTYEWKRLTVDGTRWAFVDANGKPVVEFLRRADMWTKHTEVITNREDIEFAELSLLWLTGWYVIVLMAINERVEMPNLSAEDEAMAN